MIRRPIAILPLLLLAACAAPQSSEPMVAKVPAAPPGGVWEVTAAAEADPSASPLTSPYLGQKMMLSADVAGDPAGRICRSPVYQGWDSAPRRVLGNSPAVAAARSDSVRPVLDVSCGEQPFGAYLSQPDGSLMTRVNNWVLTLNRVPDVPKPADPVAVTPLPASPPEPPPALPALSPQTLVYLASYRTEASAHKGWAVLAKASRILAVQKPMTQMVDLGKKGKWVRLYGMAANESERATLCRQLAKLVDECGARNRE